MPPRQTDGLRQVEDPADQRLLIFATKVLKRLRRPTVQPNDQLSGHQPGDDIRNEILAGGWRAASQQTQGATVEKPGYSDQENRKCSRFLADDACLRSISQQAVEKPGIERQLGNRSPQGGLALLSPICGSLLFGRGLCSLFPGCRPLTREMGRACRLQEPFDAILTGLPALRERNYQLVILDRIHISASGCVNDRPGPNIHIGTAGNPFGCSDQCVGIKVGISVVSTIDIISAVTI